MTMNIKSTLLGWLGGRGAIMRTVKNMRSMVEARRKDPVIIDTARKIMNAYGVARDDTKGEAAAIYRFLKNHIRYTRDPIDVELLQDPVITLAWRTGDCDDISVLGASLAESIGLPTRFVLYSRQGGVPHHVLFEVRTDEGWLPIDVVYNRGVGKVPQGTFETV
jgi:transglutaminase-like putative cysteine protease